MFYEKVSAEKTAEIFFCAVWDKIESQNVIKDVGDIKEGFLRKKCKRLQETKK